MTARQMIAGETTPMMVNNTDNHTSNTREPTAAFQDRVQLASSLRRLEHVMSAAGLEQEARRVSDLEQRLDSGDVRFRVALCGLFSAGKSSLINTLTAQTRLATGAVPTTSVVEEVTWKTTAGVLVLMDTPGIDSTDEAHQAATDAAMHMADMVLLIVDYQHVESAENLEMARLLSERGKRLMVVVNQVDKHLDFELSFEAFAQRVVTSLDEEGIGYERIFYTASRECAHNEIEQLRSLLQTLANAGEVAVCSSILASAHSLIIEAIDGLYAERESNADAALLGAWGKTPLDIAEARQWQTDSKRKLGDATTAMTARMAEQLAGWDAAKEGFDRSVELAQIAPYGTTELGRMYVESLRKDFKVGWIGVERKTAQERDRRIAAFAKELQQNLRQNLVWPLQRELRTFVYDNDWNEKSWFGQIDQLTADISLADLRETIRVGAVESQQYPYQYVKAVVARVKAGVLRELHATLQEWKRAALQQVEVAAEQPSPELQKAKDEAQSVASWLEVRSEKSRLWDEWLHCLNGGDG